MYKELIISGFGGQGSLALGKILCFMAMKKGLEVSHFPSYGAEMRGGTAHCHVIISSSVIASPVCEHLDILIALNQPSLTRFLPLVKKGGTVLYNSSVTPIIEKKEGIKFIPVPLTQLARDAEFERGINILALGALMQSVPELGKGDEVKKGLLAVLSQRNQSFVSINEKLYERGAAYIKEQKV